MYYCVACKQSRQHSAQAGGREILYPYAVLGSGTFRQTLTEADGGLQQSQTLR